MNKSNKYILIAVGAVVALLVLWIMFKPSTVTVEAARAARGDMLVTIDAEGRTRFKDKFTVTAPIGGQMKRIDLHEGDLIPRGYVITEIDPNPTSFPRPPAERDGSISPWSAKVYSPITGRILQLIEKNERVITAGAPIIEIGNPGPVEIVIDVLSSQATQVRPGTDVLIESEGADPVKARVRVIEPQAITKISALGVEERRVNIIADIMSKDVHYGDNFRVDVQIVVWRGKNVLSVPTSALFRNGDAWNVFVVRFGMAHRRDVQIGRQSSSQTEIVSGLDEGETVILHPPNELSENSFVRVQ